MWDLFAHAAWRVTVVSLLLGVGLPAIFAVGVRETVLATGGGTRHPSTDGRRVTGAGLHRAVGVLCFAIVVVAVVVGLAIIVASGLGKQVNFDHVYPTIVDKR